MAVLSWTYRFLFVETARTGARVIARRLEQATGATSFPLSELRDHSGRLLVHRRQATLSQLVKYGFLERSDLESLFTFTIVRNPFASLYALYERSGRAEAGLDRQPTADGQGRPAATSDRSLDFAKWVHTYIALGDRTPRHLYGPQIDGVRRVMRFESIERDFAEVCGSLGVRLLPIGTTAFASNDDSYRAAYTEESQRLVAEVFQPDLDRFGYSF